MASAILLVGIALTLKGFASGADVPLLKTPAWQGGTPEYGEQLMLRRVTAQGGDLLLKHSKRSTVYRYDPSINYLTPATDQEWQRASGPVAECGKQFAPPPQVLLIDTQSNKLMSGQRQIPTAGLTALRLTASPRGQWVAVLSAAGSPKPSLLPFFGGSGASGQHYHQVMSLPDAAVVGKAVRLPLQRTDDILIPCWSADEQLVVYHDILFTYLSVIPTDLPSTTTH